MDVYSQYDDIQWHNICNKKMWQKSIIIMKCKYFAMQMTGEKDSIFKVHFQSFQWSVVFWAVVIIEFILFIYVTIEFWFPWIEKTTFNIRETIGFVKTLGARLFLCILCHGCEFLSIKPFFFYFHDQKTLNYRAEKNHITFFFSFCE